MKTEVIYHADNGTFKAFATLEDCLACRTENEEAR